MYTKRIIFFSCLTTIINVANGDDSVFITPGQATDETVHLLHKITAKQALPLILFEVKSALFILPRFYREIIILEPCVKFTSAEIKDGRLTSWTTFHSKSSSIAIFFCPKLHSETNEQCLAPKEFGKSQTLECDLEPIPKIIDAEENCGPSGTSSRFGFVYMICPAEGSYKYMDASQNIYALCYDKTSKKMITVAYDLVEAALLEDKLFTREREIIFEMNTETYGHIDPDYYTNLIDEIRKKPQYTLQKLVPTEDMALATSRKTTQYFANFALQLEALTNVWNDIGRYFRDHAIQWKGNTFSRVTGVFDVPKSEITFQVNEQQKVNIWITVMSESPKTTTDKGLAVMINNFIIISDTKNQDADTSTSKQPYIDQLCIQNLCTDSLKEKFNAIGVEGRCCPVTKNIYKLFTGRENLAPTEILSVKNINF